jgi:hypothetical protein
MSPVEREMGQGEAKGGYVTSVRRSTQAAV